MLIRQCRKDITIEVGVRIANELAVGLGNLVVTIEVGEVDVTCLVIVLVDTVLTEDVKTGGLCLSCCGEDTQ